MPGYRLLERIGSGGAGEVWSAEAPGGLRVALKIVRLAGGLGQRERTSLRILRAIRHPNLLAYFGAWQSDGRLIIGMELADRSLWDRYVEATGQGLAGIPLSELLEILGEVAQVIDFVNEPRHQLEGRSGVAIRHRDIKPQNIMLIGRGVKVADFGLSCLSDQTGVSGPEAGLTFGYAAPETFRRQTAPATDQYSLAVTYCQLRVGRLPFVGSPAAVMHGHLFAAPDLSLLPEAERSVVGRALAKEPSSRWPSCRAFLAALAEAAAVGSPETIPAVWADIVGEASDSGSVLVPPLAEPGDESAAVSAESVSVDAASVFGRSGPTAMGLSESSHQVASESSGMPTVVAPAVAMVRGRSQLRRAILVTMSIVAAGIAVWSWKIADRAAVASLRGDRAIDRRAGERIALVVGSRTTTPEPPAPRFSPRPALGPATDPLVAAAPPEPRTAGRSPGRSSTLERDLALWTPLIRRAWAASYDWIARQSSAGRRPTEPGVGDLAARAPRRPSVPIPAPPPGRTDLGQAVLSARPKMPGPARPSSRSEVSAAGSAASLRLTLPETVRVAAGRSVSIPIEVTRGAFTGPLTVHFEGLPAGVALPDLTIPAGRSQGEARAEARPDAAVATVSLRMVARAGSRQAEATIRLQVTAQPARELESRGFALLACGRAAEAVATLTQALESGAPDPTLYHHRGVAYSFLNQLDRAIADYTEAIRLDPGNARAYEARARVYLKRGDVARSQADAARAAELTQPTGRAVLPPPAPSPPPPHHAGGSEPSR